MPFQLSFIVEGRWGASMKPTALLPVFFSFHPCFPSSQYYNGFVQPGARHCEATGCREGRNTQGTGAIYRFGGAILMAGFDGRRSEYPRLVAVQPMVTAVCLPAGAWYGYFHPGKFENGQKLVMLIVVNGRLYHYIAKNRRRYLTNPLE